MRAAEPHLAARVASELGRARIHQLWGYPISTVGDYFYPRYFKMVLLRSRSRDPISRAFWLRLLIRYARLTDFPGAFLDTPVAHAGLIVYSAGAMTLFEDLTWIRHRAMNSDPPLVPLASLGLGGRVTGEFFVLPVSAPKYYR